jgi:hypothetical protein
MTITVNGKQHVFSQFQRRRISCRYIVKLAGVPSDACTVAWTHGGKSGPLPQDGIIDARDGMAFTVVR